jgi:uroporphyrinogen-III synthase
MHMARQSAVSTGTPVLVTRPQAEGEAFAALLSARFGARVRPVVTPLLAPRCLTPDLPARDYAAVVFTSAQAVEAARPLKARLPALAWCVGRKTADAAAAAGFQARSADGDAEALIAALIADPPQGYILYLRGVDTSANLLKILNDSGLRADEIVAYVQEPQRLTPEALALLRAPGTLIVPLFSSRTAQLFRAALPADTRARLRLAAMSAKVAEALGDLPRAALAIARHPDAPGMIAAVESLLAEVPPP